MNPAKKDIWQIKGDAPDPAGLTHGGISSGVSFQRSAFGHPVVLYRGPDKDYFLTLDVYKYDGEPMQAHLFCPRCGNALVINEANKAIEYDPFREPRWAGYNTVDVCRQLGVRTLGGVISIEQFSCTWEFDGSVCGWSAAVEKGLVRR
jgi:hypothetical protein